MSKTIRLVLTASLICGACALAAPAPATPVQDGHGTGHGGETAAPVGRDMIESAIALQNGGNHAGEARP